MAHRTSADRQTGRKVVIVTFPWASSIPSIFVSQVAEIVTHIRREVSVIGCSEDDRTQLPAGVECIPSRWRMHNVRDFRPLWASKIFWIFKSFLNQLAIAYQLAARRKQIDTVVYYGAFPYHFLTLALSKILGLRNVEIVNRSRMSHGPLSGAVERVLNKLDFLLLDQISLQSPSLRLSLPLDGFTDKLTVYGARYVDFSKFRCEVPFADRGSEIGFVGRIRHEKGIFVFLEAVRLVAHRSPSLSVGDFSVTICGEGDAAGDLGKVVENLRDEHGIRVTVKGWIPNEDIPSLLNTLKILVLPTYHSEGLPTILLEAMACGVIVVAPPVGGIGDIIEDRRNGYVLHSLSPEHVSERILDALTNPHLAQISSNAIESVASRYSFEGAVERYRDIIGMQSDSNEADG